MPKSVEVLVIRGRRTETTGVESTFTGEARLIPHTQLVQYVNAISGKSEADYAVRPPLFLLLHFTNA